jgi:FkbM family methyltransferase
MATLAHRVSRYLPSPLAKRLQPYWHRARDLATFVVEQSGRIVYDRELGAWIASRPLGQRRMEVVVRSYKELRRFHQFGAKAGDVVFDWMQRIRDCELLYDIGSANGLEGFFVHHLHRSRIVFVEPFTPSIETILKTIARLQRSEGPNGFEVVQAGCDSQPGHHRLYMHEMPVPGATHNSFADPADYGRGGRRDVPVIASQWVPSISLDSLHWDLGLPLPTHVKIDIDGFEDRAMRGATRLLESGHVRSWAIEINGRDNLEEIGALMMKSGYTEVAAWEHYPGYAHYTGDHIYVRNDLERDWRESR